MENYSPLDESRIENSILRRDQEIWNLVGNYPLVISLGNTLELCREADSITNGVLNVKLRDSLCLLETTCYDILAKKHQAPSKEFIPKPATVQAFDTEHRLPSAESEDVEPMFI